MSFPQTLAAVKARQQIEFQNQFGHIVGMPEIPPMMPGGVPMTEEERRQIRHQSYGMPGDPTMPSYEWVRRQHPFYEDERGLFGNEPGSRQYAPNPMEAIPTPGMKPEGVGEGFTYGGPLPEPKPEDMYTGPSPQLKPAEANLTDTIPHWNLETERANAGAALEGHDYDRGKKYVEPGFDRWTSPVDTLADPSVQDTAPPMLNPQSTAVNPFPAIPPAAAAVDPTVQPGSIDPLSAAVPPVEQPGLVQPASTFVNPDQPYGSERDQYDVPPQGASRNPLALQGGPNLPSQVPGGPTSMPPNNPVQLRMPSAGPLDEPLSTAVRPEKPQPELSNEYEAGLLSGGKVGIPQVTGLRLQNSGPLDRPLDALADPRDGAWTNPPHEPIPGDVPPQKGEYTVGLRLKNSGPLDKPVDTLVNPLGNIQPGNTGWNTGVQGYGMDPVQEVWSDKPKNQLGSTQNIETTADPASTGETATVAETDNSAAAIDAIIASGDDPNSDLAARFINFTNTAPYHNPSKQDRLRAWELFKAGVVDPRISRNPNRNMWASTFMAMLGRDQGTRRATERAHHEGAQAWMDQHGPLATQPEGAEGYNLPDGAQRYDANNKLVAENPKETTADGDWIWKVVGNDLYRANKRTGEQQLVAEDYPVIPGGAAWKSNFPQGGGGQTALGGVTMTPTESGVVSLSGQGRAAAKPTKREVNVERTPMTTLSDGKTGTETTVTPGSKVQNEVTTDQIAGNRTEGLTETGTVPGEVPEITPQHVSPEQIQDVYDELDKPGGIFNAPGATIPYQGKGEKPKPPDPKKPQGSLQDIIDYYSSEAGQPGGLVTLPDGTVHNRLPSEDGPNLSRAKEGVGWKIADPNLTTVDALAKAEDVNAKTEGQLAYENTLKGRTTDGRQFNVRTGQYDIIVGSEAHDEWLATVDQARGTLQSARETLDVMSDVAARIKDHALAHPDATGFVGEFMKQFGGTNAKTMEALLRVLQSNTGFDKLHKLRSAREGGGGVGNVTEREFTFMINSISALEQGLKGQELADEIDKLIYHSARWQAARQLQMQYYLKQEGVEYRLQAPKDPTAAAHFQEIVDEAHQTVQFAEQASDIRLAYDRSGNVFGVNNERDREILWQREQLFHEGVRKFKPYPDATFSDEFMENYRKGAPVNALAP